MKRLFPLLLLIVGIAFGAPAPGQKDADTPDTAVAAALPSPYTLEEIPDAAGKSADLYAEIEKRLQPTEEDLQLEKRLPELLSEVKAYREKIAEKPLQEYTPQQLRNILENLRQFRQRLDKYAKHLDAGISEYTTILATLSETLRRWETTQEALRRKMAPDAIQRRAAEAVTEGHAVEKRLKKAYDHTLTYASALDRERRALEKLENTARESLAKRSIALFTIDRPPLWETLSPGALSVRHYFLQLGHVAGENLRRVTHFFLANRSALLSHLTLTLLLGFFMLYLHVRHRRGTLFVRGDASVRNAMLFVEHPLEATLLLGIFIAPLFYPDRPVTVGQLNTLAALLVLLWMMRKEAARPIMRFSLLLAVMFIVDALQNRFPEYGAAPRLVLLVMSLSLLTASMGLLRKKEIFGAKTEDRAIALFARLFPLVPVIAFVVFVADLVGAVNLAVKLFSALLASLILFMIFLMLARIAKGLIVMLVRRRAEEASRALEHQAERIQAYLVFLVNLFLMAYWFYLVLKQFDILYFLEEWWQTLMRISWRIGEVTVSVGAIVDFVLVLGVTAFLTRFVSVMLDLELFSRYRFPRGVPAAIQMIVRYLIITVGVVFALTVLGIKLTDLSIIAGALGVGIGFGLRNIMANFVSGLLLIFERPVQQGDVVQVGGVFGDIEKIGVRATTIKTYDGSEVIVPNADFITKEVTNWTLTSKSRRIKMQYKVAFGNDPRKVIEIIRQAIEKHPDIRKDPAPKILFEGYGDYYLEFTVYFWVDGRLLDIKSETALDIYEALTKAGIEMPVPFSRVSYQNQGEKR